RVDADQAGACFQQALDVAWRQQAKALELRAALSLRRLWHGQGKRAGARQLLAEDYSWVTGGFDTADLQEAKTLVAEVEVGEPTNTDELLGQWLGEARQDWASVL